MIETLIYGVKHKHMASKALKLARVMSAREAAAFLRELADTIESGHIDNMKEFDVHIDDFKKLKIGLKRSGEEIEIKAKVKYTAPPDPGDTPLAETGREAGADQATEKYTKLKKRMEKTFKAMDEATKAGSLPDPALVESFLADSARMVTYPGKGDEFYERYGEACRLLADAFASGDVAGTAERLSHLKALRKECHAIYK